MRKNLYPMEPHPAKAGLSTDGFSNALPHRRTSPASCFLASVRKQESSVDFLRRRIKILFFFILLLPGIVTGCATLPRQPLVQKETYLKDLCQQYHLQWQWDHFTQVVTLNNVDTQVRAMIDSPMVILGEETIELDAPLEVVKSTIVVPPDFHQRVIEAIRKGSTPQIQKKRSFISPAVQEIIIDAGHGGKDPGAIGHSGLKEKTVVLDIAKRLYRILKQGGIQVIMTRQNDEFISLQKRTEIASSTKADLFVSIHANASTVRGVNGMEVFSLRDLDYLEKNESQRRMNHNILFEHLKMHPYHPDLGNIISDMLYTHKLAESDSLAVFVCERTSMFVKAKNRGLKHSGFYVLRNTLIPAILVEVGYLSNPKEENLLRKGAYRQKIAEGLAESLLEYARGAYAKVR